MSGIDPYTLPLMPDDPELRRCAERLDLAFLAASALQAEIDAKKATDRQTRSAA